MNNFFKIFILFTALFFVVEASHFRFGTISWQPTTAHNIIKFSSNFAFRTTFFKSSTSSITIGESITLGTLQFGDGQGSISVSAQVTNFDVTNDWFTASFTTTKTYTALAAGVTKNITAIFTDCCRIGSLLNNANGDWNVTTLVQLNNKDALADVNYSPVSGMLPIYQVIANKNNNFRILASDPNGAVATSELKFSFSKVYTMTQPSGMTIDSTGNCYFLPTSVGLYSTQIYILDNRGAYSVVDFILQSVVEPGKCELSCSNPGASCNANSDCKNCANTGSKDINTCTTSVLPPFFVTPPSVTDGKTISFPVGNATTFVLSCDTSVSGRTATVQAANIPLGVASVVSSKGTQQNITYSWTPSAGQVGAYVASAYCSDTAGLTSSVRSFTLFVGKPDCGNGDPIPNSDQCKCLPNWDPSKRCFECLDGFYGPNCVPSTNCNGHGTSNDGILGDGKCLCSNGWTGADCSVTLSKSCSALKSSQLSSTNAVPSYFNPSLIQIYLDDQPNYAIPSILSVPRPINLLDVYVLVDANMGTDVLFGYIKSAMSTFVTGVNAKCETTQYGLGYFSDYTANPITFQPSLVIGSAVSAGINVYSPATYSTTTNKNSLLAATKAASTSLGWNTGSFKAMVIITDNDHGITSMTDASVTAFINTFVDASIVPIVIGYGVDTPNWASVIAAAQFGYTAKATASSNDWASKAVAGVTASLSTVVFKSSQSATGSNFVSSLPSNVAVSQTASTQVNVNGITITKPTNPTVSTPVASISAMGYGGMNIIINYNRPPVATSSAFAVNQNSQATFSLSGTDPDSNLLTFKFTTFLNSSEGKITNNGVDVSTQPSKYYDSTESFVCTPANNHILPASVKFIANDGCVDSTSEATVSITINRVNQPPTCKSTTATAILNSAVSFTFTGDDFENPTSIGFQFVKPTDLTAYGTLTYNGAAITTSTTITDFSKVAFTQTVNPVNGLNVVTQFKAIDPNNALSSACTFTVTFVHTNIAPVVSGTSPVSVIPRGSVQFDMVSSDSDSTTSTFTITAIGGSGTFYDCSSQATIAVNKQYTANIVSSKATQSICFKNDVNIQATNYANITFNARDNQNALSLNTYTTIINIVGNRTNTPPVVTQIPNYSCYQDYSTSSQQAVDGTDEDPDDIGNLVAIIVTPPTSGVLIFSVNGVNTTSISQSKAPLLHYYRPNPGFKGSDSYSYQVKDTFNSLSGVATTTVTVVPINHAPTVTVDSYSFSSTAAGTVHTLNTADSDGDQVQCSVVTLPKQVTMYNVDNVQVKAGDTLKTNSYSFQLADASATTPKYSSFQDSFTVNCKDVTTKTTPYGSLSTGNVAGTIYYTYVNTAPTTVGGTVYLDQDSSASFTFNGTDIETPVANLKVKIISLPAFGTLSLTSDGTIVKSANVGVTKYNLDDLTYTPNAGLSNWNTIDNKSPLDATSYTIVDSQDLPSSSAVIQFSVRPRNPPTYNGADTINVLQNTRYPLTITGQIGNGGSEVSIKVISFTGRGNFSISYAMGSEGSMDKLITKYPSDLLAGSTSYNFAYNPPHNQFGNDFDTIVFQLIDNDLVSMDYTIKVNVIHVNQAPTIKLISYKDITNANSQVVSLDGTLTVNMNINTSVLIKYQGLDVDIEAGVQPIPLVSVISNIPLRGALYNYDPTAQDSLGAKVTPSNTVVKQSDDGYFYIVFVPAKGSSGDAYVRIPLKAKDDGGLESPPVIPVINVNTFNIPPFITIGNRNFAGLVNSTITVNQVTFDDPDSTYNNVKLIISIVTQTTSDGQVVDTVSSNNDIKFTLTQNTGCTIDASLATATCIGTKNANNNLIKTINVVARTSGSYKLKVFVDDLGYSAPLAIREQSHLTATDYVDLTITPPEVTTKPNSNKTVLTGAIAGAAAGAALIAAGLWGILRKAAPPTDIFFGEAAFQGDGVSSNPLYTENANNGVNPLYEAGAAE